MDIMQWYKQYMRTIWLSYSVLVFLLAAVSICGCVADDNACSRASSLYEQAETGIQEIDWETDPPELTGVELQGAEADLNEALTIVGAVQPDLESAKPSTAYALNELILAKLAYVSAAREVATAQIHILNAGDAAELYQYSDWDLELHAALGNIGLARTELSLSDSRVNKINMTLVPVEMRSDIVEARALNANFANLITSLEGSVEIALQS